jgi:hypothetical protein
VPASVTEAPYPAFSIAVISSDGAVDPLTIARPRSKSTLALFTPGTLDSTRSTVRAQPSQVIPVTASVVGDNSWTFVVMAVSTSFK